MEHRRPRRRAHEAMSPACHRGSSILYPLSALLLALALTALPVRAQDAGEFFHEGAQAYAHEEMAQAEQAVEQGLRLAPDDPKLLALKQKLEQQQQQQQQNQQNQDQQQQDQQQQENQEQQDEQQQNQQDPQEQQDQQSQQEQNEQQRDEQEQQDEQQPQEQQGQPDDEQQQEETPQPQDLSPEELNKLSEEQALRILQALEQDEEKLLREVLKPKARARRVEKDW